MEAHVGQVPLGLWKKSRRERFLRLRDLSLIFIALMTMNKNTEKKCFNDKYVMKILNEKIIFIITKNYNETLSIKKFEKM